MGIHPAIPESVLAGLSTEAFGEPIDQGPSRSATRERSSIPDALRAYEGRPSFYRLVFAGSSVRGWVSPLRIHDVVLVPWEGPVSVQSTSVHVRPVSPLSLEKIMHRRDVGHGRPLVIGIRPFSMSLAEVSLNMERHRQEVLAAVGKVATILDERFATEELGENVVVLDKSGSGAERYVDASWRVRHYRPDLDFPEALHEAAASLARNPVVDQAARWYFKGAREGPTADGIMWLCAAIESLADPLPNQSKRFNRAAIERAISHAGDDPGRFSPSIGRIAGLRADVIHYGKEDPTLLREGFYVLEEVVRLILRHRLGSGQGAWPVRPETESSEKLTARLRRRANHRWMDGDE